MICDECQALYEEVGDRAREAKVFGKVRRTDDALKCRALHVDSEAYYRVEVDLPSHERIFIGLYTPDRWLSESVEADLVHSGDKIEELLEEELVDKGFETPLPIEHYRDENKHFVFRSTIDVHPGDIDSEAVIETVEKVLLAYEACFRELGDMRPADEFA